MNDLLNFVNNTINYCQGEIENDPATSPKYTFTIDVLEEIKKRIHIENSKII